MSAENEWLVQAVLHSEGRLVRVLISAFRETSRSTLDGYQKQCGVTHTGVAVIPVLLTSSGVFAACGANDDVHSAESNQKVSKANRIFSGDDFIEAGFRQLEM